jgi:hypothetical protein
MWSQQSSREPGRHVILANMSAIGLYCQCHVYTVVHDQEGTSLSGQGT